MHGLRTVHAAPSWTCLASAMRCVLKVLQVLLSAIYCYCSYDSFHFTTAVTTCITSFLRRVQCLTQCGPALNLVFSKCVNLHRKRILCLIASFFTNQTIHQHERRTLPFLLEHTKSLDFRVPGNSLLPV